MLNIDSQVTSMLFELQYFSYYCPTRGMGEKPSPLGEDLSLIVDAAVRIQGVKDSSKSLDGLFT